MQTQTVTPAHALSLYAQARAAQTLSAYMDAAGAMASVLSAKRLAKAPAAIEVAPGQMSAPALSAALARALRVIETRSRFPILTNVRLKACESWLEVTATDLDIETFETLGAEGIGIWDLTVNAKALADVLKRERGPVSLIPTVETLCVRSGSVMASLPLLPSIDFPVMAPPKNPERWGFAVGEFIEAAKAVQFAISTEETRYYLNGAFLHVVNGVARLVATDGHRLMQCDLPHARPGANGGGVIIPRKTFDLIARMAGATDGDRLEVALGSDKIDAWSGGLRIRSKLIDGSFPDYQRVIPSASDVRTKIEGDCKRLSESFASVAAASTEKAKSLKLDVCGHARPEGLSRVTATVRNIEGASVSGDVPVTVQGASVQIGFNATYLADACAFGGRVRFGMADAASPVRVEYPDAPNRLGVLMPLRV